MHLQLPLHKCLLLIGRIAVDQRLHQPFELLAAQSRNIRVAAIASQAVQCVLCVVFGSSDRASLLSDGNFGYLMSLRRSWLFEHLDAQIQAVRAPLRLMLLQMIILTEGIEACEAQKNASRVLGIVEAPCALILVDRLALN